MTMRAQIALMFCTALSALAAESILQVFVEERGLAEGRDEVLVGRQGCQQSGLASRHPIPKERADPQRLAVFQVWRGIAVDARRNGARHEREQR